MAFCVAVSGLNKAVWYPKFMLMVAISDRNQEGFPISSFPLPIHRLLDLNEDI